MCTNKGYKKMLNSMDLWSLFMDRIVMSEGYVHHLAVEHSSVPNNLLPIAFFLTKKFLTPYTY